MSAAHQSSVTLFGAKDSEGRLYLTDRRDSLPKDAEDIREFAVALDRVEWTILAVEMEETRTAPATG